MHIAFKLKGFYDWDKADRKLADGSPAYPGLAITKADVNALRAKKDALGNWLIRVERPDVETDHGAHIHETTLCSFIVLQALFAGNMWSRADAACELMAHSFKHHGRSDHIVDASLAHDGGPSKEIMEAVIEKRLTEYRENLPRDHRTQLDDDALAMAGAKANPETGHPLKRGTPEGDALLAAVAPSHDAIVASSSASYDATIAQARGITAGVMTRYLATVDLDKHVRARFAPHAIATTKGV